MADACTNKPYKLLTRYILDAPGYRQWALLGTVGGPSCPVMLGHGVSRRVCSPAFAGWYLASVFSEGESFCLGAPPSLQYSRDPCVATLSAGRVGTAMSWLLSVSSIRVFFKVRLQVAHSHSWLATHAFIATSFSSDFGV